MSASSTYHFFFCDGKQLRKWPKRQLRVSQNSIFKPFPAFIALTISSSEKMKITVSNRQQIVEISGRYTRPKIGKIILDYVNQAHQQQTDDICPFFHFQVV